ncbi:phage terminase small subunit-related protein [Bernardetia sp. ABR2-2B]|uniref:phage terminase small subunit-related protein n=1 Tax=Bernardetia sp. ABR2-2B TaxID=3127472 RepID=UPI0030D43AC3
MNRQERDKKIAENYYIYLHKSQKDIADELGYAERTILNWKNEGKWDEKRQDAEDIPIVQSRIVITTYRKIETELQKEAPSWDDLSKAGAFLDRFNKGKSHIGTMTQVAYDFFRYLFETDQKRYVKVALNLIDNFLKYRIKNGDTGK